MVGWYSSIVRKNTASDGRMKLAGVLTSSSRTSSNLDLPHCFSGLVIARYGVCSIESAM
jgi:hypothetical protein